MRKLTVRLLLACLSCAVMGLGVYRLTYVVGMTVVNRMLNNEEYTDQLLQNEVERIQELVDQNRMTEEEVPVLQDDLPYTVAVVGSKNQSTDSSADSTAMTSVPPTEQTSEPTLKNSFLVETAGGIVEMVIFPNFASGYENLVNITGMFAGFLVFGLSFILIIRKRVVYIQQLISEVNLLESGNLEIPVTVKGEDELADLAQSMEDMRKATILREQALDQANIDRRNLVTSMSHDLRTPLTSLMGYLNLLKESECQSDALRFTDMSIKQANRIKELSDDLFAYSLSSDSSRLDLQPYPAFETNCQLVSDFILELEESGFTVEEMAEGFEGTFTVDIPSLHRVYENILSNIKKYADNTVPIRITSGKENGMLVVTIENTIKEIIPLGTGVGMKTCEQLLSLQEGMFKGIKNGTHYTTTIQLPIQK